jgi:cellulose synthase/poly-beta-1,6-N-acetylglucosamine synthase-like glycosyltransferase
VLIVDNNSTDDTRSVVEHAFGRSRIPVSYIFEPRQGVSHGRNAGIQRARAPIIAFTDDDIRPAPDWIASIWQAFAAHPEIECLGGKVLPRWPEHVPSWLTKRQTAPLAILDRGDREIPLGADYAAPCLYGANLACRRSAFLRAGLFSPEYLRTEDREIQLRMWRAGVRGLYVPTVVAWVDVPPERLTKAYFRMWFDRTGPLHARMRLLEILDRDGRLVEPPPARPLWLGVPPYLYRELAAAIGAWMAAVAAFRSDGAFYYENRVRYVGGYVRERLRQHRSWTRRAVRGPRRIVRARHQTPATRSAPMANAGRSGSREPYGMSECQMPASTGSNPPTEFSSEVSDVRRERR